MAIKDEIGLSIFRETVVLASGIFDLLHPGHVTMFEYARSLGQRLIVAVNDDKSARQLKGPGRPIYNERERLFMVRAVRWVDEAFIFHGLRLDGVIRERRPTIWVKGSDRTLETLDEKERDAAFEVCCAIRFMERCGWWSTTELIRRLKV